jgi:2-dehydro-3-deoxy-D-gluconate 5-dehydrogenase
MGMFDLSGRVAVVTGGNGGIGLGMARGLAAAGAAVVITGRNRNKLEAARKDLQSLNAKCALFEADVTEDRAAQKIVDFAVGQFGGVNILVNNAGSSIRKMPEALTLADWHFVMNLNLTAAFACSQAVYAPMKQAGGGKIINIGSMLSIFGAPYAAPYAASKGGIVQMSKAMATAWAKDNIQVNSVLPGWIDTDLTKGAREQVPGLHERVLGRTPAGRWGVPNDLSGIAVFLAAPASDFITGAAIPVDGGFSSQG